MTAATGRKIVRDDDILDGLWRLDGHRIGVCHIRAWVTSGHSLDDINGPDIYPHLALTQPEFARVMTWPEPEHIRHRGSAELLEQLIALHNWPSRTDEYLEIKAELLERLDAYDD